MLVAGEPSGDLLAAELVEALRRELIGAGDFYPPDFQPLRTGLEPRFFGAGGPCMKAAGVELAFDLTADALIGIPNVKQYLAGRRRFHELLRLALDRQPDVIVGVDYNYFNLRFARAIREYVRPRRDWFHTWQPRLVKFISPQVWASRGSRAHQLERDFDLLLSIFPFERDWYARRVPRFRVEFVGHPLLDRVPADKSATGPPSAEGSQLVLLLPGSRRSELKRHVPVMIEAWKRIHEKLPATRAKMVLPESELALLAKSLGVPADVDLQTGGMSSALAEAALAVTKTGTVTTECAVFGVPAVTIYKTSWLTYGFGKSLVNVNSLTMPNLLAGEAVYPEFIQGAATPENISRAALELLQDESRREQIRGHLKEIAATLGGPGASRRAAQAIARLLTTNGHE